MENFTPFASLIGGILIGLSAAMMWFFNGRIAGISGILPGGHPEIYGRRNPHGLVNRPFYGRSGMNAVHLIAFVAGLIFSVGLAIGGMTQNQGGDGE